MSDNDISNHTNGLHTLQKTQGADINNLPRRNLIAPAHQFVSNKTMKKLTVPIEMACNYQPTCCINHNISSVLNPCQVLWIQARTHSRYPTANIRTKVWVAWVFPKFTWTNMNGISYMQGAPSFIEMICVFLLLQNNRYVKCA